MHPAAAAADRLCKPVGGRVRVVVAVYCQQRQVVA